MHVIVHAAEEMEEQAESASILCQRCNLQVSLNGEFVPFFLVCTHLCSYGAHVWMCKCTV